MRRVWFVFRVMEMCAALCALGYHVAAILNYDHPMEHVMHLCGTYFGFFLLSIFMNVGTALNQKIPMLYETIIALCGFLLFTFAAFSTMYLAEKDYALQFLLELEEIELTNFRYYKGQFISLVCISLHIQGFLYLEEPFHHVVFFCGTYFGFAVIEILLNVGYFMSIVMPVFLEAIIGITSCLLFITSSILTQFYTEIDLHLEYLSDEEETSHMFFVNSRRQSIASLVGGALYLLHSVFAIDDLISAARINTEGRITEVISDIRNNEDIENTPLELHFFIRPLFKMTMCCRTCQHEEEAEVSRNENSSVSAV